MRTLYCLLLWLHPPGFRREFSREMLWIFDEASGNYGVTWLFRDAFVSLARQWLVASIPLWKLLGALAGAFLTVSLAGSMQPRMLRGLRAIHVATPQELLLLSACAAIVAVSMTVTLCVLWFRMSRRRHA